MPIMIPYVNLNAKVLCPVLAGNMSVQETTNQKVKIAGQLALTQAGAKLTGNGTCGILTAAAGGTPQPCQCKNSSTLTGWKNVSANKACGSSLLLQTSVNQCTVGSLISIPYPGQLNAIKGIPATDIFISIDSVMTKNADNRAEVSPQNKNQADSSSKTGINDVNKSFIGKVKNSGIDENKENITKGESKKNESNCAVCSQNNTCEFFHQWEKVKEKLKLGYPPLNYEGNAQLLKKNYEEEGAPNGKQYLMMLEKYGIEDWSYAAHHILSANQVVSKQENEVLAAMVNYCDMDINDARNAIMLPTIKKYDIKKSITGNKLEESMAKHVKAYDVMSCTGMQWHVGHHAYKFSETETRQLREMIHRYRWKCTDAGIRHAKENERTEQIKSYAELLGQEMDELKRKYFSQGKCPRRYKKRFEEAFWGLAKRIMDKLNAFSRNPRYSYPYYVSAPSYLYAFSMPVTSKIILVWPAENGNYIQKFRVERFNEAHQNRQNNVDVNIVNFQPIKGLNAIFYQGNNDSEKYSLIEYCENIKYFLFTGESSATDLPFSAATVKAGRIRDAHRPQGDDGTAFLKHNNIAVMEWLRKEQEVGDEPYIAPLKMIKERLNSIR